MDEFKASMKMNADRDFREDGVESQLNLLDSALAELNDSIERLGSRIRPYLRPEEPRPTDGMAKALEPEYQPCSDIGGRVRNARERANTAIRTVAELNQRVDD